MKLIALIAGVLALGTALKVRPQEENHDKFWLGLPEGGPR